jgi:outer membrane protein OmpA-like peptidoglycan-associated protein
MRTFYSITWLLLSALVVWYMMNSNVTPLATVDDGSDDIVVIDEVKGSNYTQALENEGQEDSSGENTEGDNSSTSKDDGDYRKEGKSRFDFLEKVYIEFDQNKTTVPKNPKFSAYLDSVAVLINEDDFKVALIGHTDNTSSQNNYEIGLKRANHIKDLLLSRSVDETKIIVESKGEEEPRIEGDSPEAHIKNRRVELFLKPN